MTDIKIKKSIIKGWDWNSILAAHFPEWWHDYANKELRLHNICNPNGAVVVTGRAALRVLESAYHKWMEPDRPYRPWFEDGIRDRIRMVRELYDLDNRETRIKVIEAWDWDRMLRAFFPKWFHEYADESLCNSGISYGVITGREALEILESACSQIRDREKENKDERIEIILDCINKARDLYGLDSRDMDMHILV